MATINHGEMQREAGVGGGEYQETNGQRQGWKNLVLNYMQNLSPKPLADTTFLVKGCIYTFLFDNGKYFTEDVTNDQGKTRKRAYTKAVCCITDPDIIAGPIEDDEYRLEFPPKKITASFFDGWTKKGRSDIRGGMFTVHYAVTHEEPPKELIDGQGAWDTDAYERHPVLLRIRYKGKTDETSPYFNRRARRTFFVDGFERDPDHTPSHLQESVDDLEDDEPNVAPPVVTPAAPTKAASGRKQKAPPAGGGNGPTGAQSETSAPAAVATDALTAEWDEEL